MVKRYKLEKTLIENGIIVTMNLRRDVFFKNSGLLIEEDKIAAIGNNDEIKKKYKVDVTINAKDKIVMPGLVSLHFHSGNYIRGVGEHMGLEEWLEKLLYPVIATMDPRDTYISACIAYAEAVLTGTTTINNMFHHMINCADAAEDVGVRAVLSSEACDLIEGQPSMEDNERLFREKNGAANGRISVWYGVEWIPICSEEFLLKARELATRYKTGIHIHLNESRGELEASLEKHGRTPVELVYKLGLLGRDVVAAHCVWLSEDEKRILVNTGTSVAHCPVSNAKLGNGIAPIPELMKLGVNVGLGPDDAPCNNTVNMFETMKYCSCIHKARLIDATQMPAKTVMEMATINGAKALMMEDKIGSLEVGKKADIVLLNINVPSMRPIFVEGPNFNVDPLIVFGECGDYVDSVIIDGKMIVEHKELKTIDLSETIKEYQSRSEGVMERKELHKVKL